jgi:hypothetical protein
VKPTWIVAALVLSGCASQADLQAQWQAYAAGQCAPLKSSGGPAEYDRCVVDVVARCQSDRNISGMTQKGCRP